MIGYKLDREWIKKPKLTLRLLYLYFLTKLNLRACLKSSSLSQKILIFEHRSAVYIRVNEQWSAENRHFMPKIGDFKQALRTALNNVIEVLSKKYYLF